jgi:hypothetical protein
MNSKINGIIEDGNVPLKEKRRAIHEIVKAERQVENISKETA